MKTQEQIKAEIKELEYQTQLLMNVPGTKAACEASTAIRNELIALTRELKEVDNA